MAFTTVPDGATVSSVKISWNFFQAGELVDGGDDTGIASASIVVPHTGAGVYLLQGEYTLSTGDIVVIGRLIKVNGLGAVVAEVKYNGAGISNVNGLLVDLTSYINQTGQSEIIRWAWATADFGSNGALGNGSPLVGAEVDASAEIILNYVDLDGTVWDDLPAPYISNPAAFSMYSVVHITT